MIAIKEFYYRPNLEERERASNSYLMSLVVIVVGMPVPIVNLIASGIYYLGNTKSTTFVRWHCIQVMFTQLFLFVINAIGVGWLLLILFGNWEAGNYFFAYLAVLFGFNLSELIGTIVSAVQIQKGLHPRWWLFGDLTDAVMSEMDYE